jgi:hypothetical protein
LKRKFKKKIRRRKIMAKRRKTKTVYRTVSRARGRAKRSMFGGTGGRVLIGSLVGLGASFITPRLPPTAAVLMDDASDIAATFIGGKWALVGNMVGKRIAPLLVRQATGSTQFTGDAA